jgi:AraC family transcriptional regulator
VIFIAIVILAFIIHYTVLYIRREKELTIQNDKLENVTLPSLIIPKGIYAKFSLSGKYGDVIKLIQWVYHYWLIDSGYETTTNPSYTIYHKNHFLSLDEEFMLDYYVPIKYV